MRLLQIVLTLACCVALASFFIGCGQGDTTTAPQAPVEWDITDAMLDEKAVTGNGGPSGPHFNLNIIGVSNDKDPDMTNNK